MSESVETYGVSVDIAMAARMVNESQPSQVASIIYDLSKAYPSFPDTPKISFLGLAFKGRPETDDLRGSMSIHFVEEINKFFPSAKCYGFDYMVKADAIDSLGLTPCGNIEDAFRDSHIVLILNNHPGFSEMPIESLGKIMNKPSIIYDLWNNFSAKDIQLPDLVTYAGLGSLSSSHIG